jgi:hypothetical protein
VIVLRARIAYLLISVVILGLVWPTTGVASWDWIVSGEGEAIARCAATDAEGNVYIAGEFQDQMSLDALTLFDANGLGGDIFLLKLTPDGQVVWGRSAVGERLDRCRAVVCDTSGRVYVAGEFCSNSITFDTITLENEFQSPYIDLSFFDVFTACYDEDGSVVWARKAGGAWHDYVNGIARDGTGAAYILGTFQSPVMTFDTVSVTNSGNVDFYLAKYDENGHIQWAGGAVGTDQEAAWSVAVDSHDCVYIAGSHLSPTLTIDGTVLTNTSDTFDIYLAKYDTDGGAVWARTAVGREWDDATALAIDQWDNLYVAGHFDSDTLSFGTHDLVLSSAGGTNIDMYLARLDGDGLVTWATSSSGAAWIYPQSACVLNSNRIAVAGTFVEPGSSGPEYIGPSSISSNGSYDIFLVDYDLNGNPLSAASYGGTDMDFAQDVCGDYEGNLILGAFFSSDSLEIGAVTLRNYYQNKMLVAKRFNSIVTATPEDEPGAESAAQGTFLVNTPNPFNAHTVIAYDVIVAGYTRLEIFDARGRLIRTMVDRVQREGRHTAVWDGRDARGGEVASGTYFYRLSTKSRIKSGKMTLAK